MRRPLRLILPALSLLILIAPVTLARADTASARFALGLGGDVEVEDSEDDLDTTLGLDLVYLHDLHPHVALGGGLGLLWWLGDSAAEDADKNLFVDLSFRPEGRLALSKVQLFVAALVGLTHSSIGEDQFALGDVDSAFGWHAGAELGGRVSIGAHGGVELGLAFLHHEAEHEIDTVVGSTSADGSVTGFLLRLGGFWSP